MDHINTYIQVYKLPLLNHSLSECIFMNVWVLYCVLFKPDDKRLLIFRKEQLKKRVGLTEDQNGMFK